MMPAICKTKNFAPIKNNSFTEDELTNFIDGRNIYHPNYVRQQGFHYLGIGR